MTITINTILGLDLFVSRYCLGVLFILGVIGLTLNTITFTRRAFRNTSCILYFLSSTLANYPVIYFVIPCRFLADGFNIDPTITSLGFCKLREYILTVSRSLSAWFIVLASFDRLMSSSRHIHHRQFCHIHIARWVIILTTIIHLFFYIHIPIMYQNHVQNDQCEAPSDVYRIINDCLYSLCYVIVPALLMLIFGLLTIHNRKKRRIMPAFTGLNIIKRDRNLFLMIIFQFILFTLSTLPQGVQKLYTTLTINDIDQDAFQIATTNLFIHTVRMISFINHSCQFYIFTLSSNLFRQELQRSLKTLIAIKYTVIKKPNVAVVILNNNQIHFQASRQVQ